MGMTKYEQETLLEDGLSLLASAIPHLSSHNLAPIVPPLFMVKYILD